MNQRRLRIVIVAWDLAHNGANCAFFLADLLRRHHDVEIVGPLFTGEEVWEPIRDSGIPIRAFPGRPLPEFLADAEAFVNGIEADVVYASKPRLPAFLLAMLLKQRTAAPVLMHVDDLELGFVGASEGMSLDELERYRTVQDFAIPWGPTWVRASDSLIRGADAVTVSGSELQHRYGGTIVAQARDEASFDPDRFDRAEVRAEFGYSYQDRVVLFVGFPRRHKGVLELAEAVAAIDDPCVKLCVVGSFNEPDLRERIATLDPDRINLLDSCPVSEVPRMLMLGDLVCLPQDTSAAHAMYQTPMKLTEALAMGVPVLARETPSLRSFVKSGLLRRIDDRPLSVQIEEMLADRAGLARMAARGRSFFVGTLSYAAALETVESLIAGLKPGDPSVPAEWLAARDVAASAYSPMPAPPPGTPSRECPVCGSESVVLEPGPADRPDAQCRVCGSLERHRLAWLYLSNETNLFSGDRARQLLLLGVEPVLAERLATDPLLHCVNATVDPASADLDFRDGSFDVVYSHQRLERVPDDGRAIREMFRVLAPGGWGLIQIRPLASQATVEAPELTDPETRRRRFGHPQYVRRYGRDFPDRLAAAGFAVTVDRYSQRIGEHSRRHFGLAASDQLFLLRRPAIGEPGSVEHLLSSAPAPPHGRTPATRAVVQGRVEAVIGGQVTGWAWRPAAPDWRPGVRVVVDGQNVGGGIAELHSESCERSEIGDGYHGFAIPLPAELATAGHHLLELVADGGRSLETAADFVIRAGPTPSPWDRAGFTVSSTAQGRLEAVRDGAVHGWAWHPAGSDEPVRLRVLLDGREVARGLAHLARSSTHHARPGNCGFRIELDVPQAGRHTLRIETDDQTALPAAGTFAFECGAPTESTASFMIDACSPSAWASTQGRIESCGDLTLRGWAWRPQQPAARPVVRVVVDGVEIAAGVACLPRPDLAAIGIGDGRYGFEFPLAPALRGGPSHTLSVIADDGTPLPATASLTSIAAAGLPDYRVGVTHATYRATPPHPGAPSTMSPP